MYANPILEVLIFFLRILKLLSLNINKSLNLIEFEK